MKQIFYSLAFCLLLCIGRQATGQVTTIDISTGVDATGNLIPILSNDDTWEVSLPGTSVYQPVRCGTGILEGYTIPYAGKSPNVRWLSPYLDAAGAHGSNAPAGIYLYRTTIPLECVGPQTQAELTFNHIGADNSIDAIIVNGTSYPVNYSFNPFGSGSLNIGASLINGVNEIILSLTNLGQWTGMEIDGNLQVVGLAPPPDPSFCISAQGTVKATPNTGGLHTWEVYSSPDGGITGKYTPLFTSTSDNIEITHGGPCYYIKHTLKKGCGSACAAQMVCKTSCDFAAACGLAKPTNLTTNLTKLGNTFSWSTVPGASSYEITIYANDLSCCGSTLFSVVTIFKTTDTSFVKNLSEIGTIKCFSWSVRAFCKNGSSIESDRSCYTFPVLVRNPEQSKEAINPEQGISLNLYPNPGKGIVTFDVKTDNEQELIIEVFDISGKLVKKFGPENTRNKIAGIRWNTESLAKGTYLVKVTTADQKTITQKLQIE
jgi:hypothetical protein